MYPALFMLLLLSDDPTVALLFGSGFGVFSFFKGFRLLRNKRMVENTPTSKCRSVAMGQVEVIGKAVGEATTTSLIGKLPCYCSHVTVERYERRGKESSWRQVHQEVRNIQFQVEDETGRVKVDPTGAEFDVALTIEYSSQQGLSNLLGLTLSRLGDVGVSSHDIPGLFQSYCSSRGVSWSGPMRFRERNLSPGDPVYVLGVAQEIPGVQDEQERILIQKGKNHPWFFVAEGSQKDVLSRMGTSTYLHIYGGAALALVCFGILLAKFGWW